MPKVNRTYTLNSKDIERIFRIIFYESSFVLGRQIIALFKRSVNGETCVLLISKADSKNHASIASIELRTLSVLEPTALKIAYRGYELMEPCIE